MNISNALSILSLLGIGTAIGTYLRILWERKNKAQSEKQDYKTTRYKAIMLLMYSLLDFEKEKARLEAYRPNLSAVTDVVDELKTEWHNMLLYASDGVIYAMQEFILQPTKPTFYKATLQMRKDLWGGSLSLNLTDIKM